MSCRLLSMMAAGVLASSPALPFELTSPDFRDQGVLGAPQVANFLGCSGGNLSPALHWKGAPGSTKSFVVTLYDPDAPTGSGWWHWTVFNIPASATSMPAGAGRPNSKSLPSGAIQGRNDAGQSAFMGACPPPGPAHHYILTITALRVEKLDLSADTSGAMIGFVTKANALDSASIIATFGR